MNKPVLMLAAAALLVLPACSKKPETQAQAGGEILEGSISDAMLPLDTATSQPPLAPKTVNKADSTGDDKETAEDEKPDAPAAEPAPKAPAAEAE